jgi:hypothetical protein
MFVVIVLSVGLAIAFSFAMNSAADELRAEINIASSQPPDNPRTPWGVWLGARMAADLPSDDYSRAFARAEDLDHRADRIRDLGSAASVVGLVLMLATARPEAPVNGLRAETSPLASTRSNGTV